MNRAVKLGLIGLVAFLMFRAMTAGYENTDNASGQDRAATEQSGPRSDPPEIRESKIKVDAVVRHFVKAYYHRDERLFVGGMEDADSRFQELLSPLVTSSFMDEYVTSLDIPQNELFVNGTFELKARVEEMSYHGHLENGEADRSASVVLTWYKLGEPVERQKMDIEFLLEKQDGSWRVAGCTCGM